MGLFVATIWVSAGLHFGYSGFAGSLALAALMLPIVIRSCEEMLKLVPDDLRQASDALGARRWRTVLSVVLPAALPGIVSGAMLAVARAAGETAPLLFTIGVTTSMNANPFHGTNTTLSQEIWFNAQTPFAAAKDRAWGAALTLIVIVFVFTVIARVVSARFATRPALARLAVRLLRLVAEVPFEDEVLALGVAGDALAVAAELRVVDGQQLQPGHRPLAELVDRALVAEDAVDLPVRRDRAGVHHPHVTLRRDLFELFGVDRHHALLVRRRIRVAAGTRIGRPQAPATPERVAGTGFH